MKSILLAAAICCGFLASCSTYQLNVINGNAGSRNEKTGEWFFENDSVKISYAFDGRNGPVTVNVYNKLEKPIYIDWQKSALIVDDKAISYVPDQLSLTGTISSATNYFYWGNSNWVLPNATAYTTGNINANITLPKYSTYLPPHTQSSINTLHLKDNRLFVADTAYHSVPLVKTYGDAVSSEKVKQATFNSDNSPFKFKSYLTMFVVNGNETSPATYQHSFYVSRSVLSETSPELFDEFARKRGDFFISR
ncbi:hypothetical protein IM792_18690 [Mucilaginibacter sp. JRF]|uniref:hypothetical protein n=1 Tax=Mucilaginibacter sp. JRF TaxID=2780088 RepID=UPI001880609B|nr:hypothetical protein [Mucilaginibacter sp. JRF]MBE9586483.1 hypothetical protein [Mucilaginibacter sp. JRF]